jgi:hypothetical protein
MSNLQSAKSAIEAEIMHARQGVAFYQSRLHTLEKTLDQLDSVSLPEDIIQIEEPKQSSSARAKTAHKRGRGRPSGSASSGKELPTTGADYWLDLVSDQPQSGAEILRQAVARLGFHPNKLQVQKLRQRLAPGLKALLQAQKIQDSGAGRERRFFKG